MITEIYAHNPSSMDIETKEMIGLSLRTKLWSIRSQERTWRKKLSLTESIGIFSIKSVETN